ncbi:hypothetical protein AB0E06_00905 [Streptomyces sp. NPDC048109]|uniref:hypothetical protein n=1 Tax=unclassified Streptomyces TaxID=2593676 RepID=UPI0033EDB01D
MRIDDEPADPHVWVGGVDVLEAATRTSKQAARTKDSLAAEVSQFLQEQRDA